MPSILKFIARAQVVLGVAVLAAALTVTVTVAAQAAERHPGPVAHAAATCSDYDTQAEAQRAADTRDPDNDGVYCESLPCPCEAGGGPPPADAPPSSPPKSCTRPAGVQNISFSMTAYPNIRRHFLRALRHGWPRTLVINRKGADARRDRLLRGRSTRDGFDRDEYPPAVGRGRGKGLERGSNPRGWRASVQFVPSRENSSHGARLGAKLRRFCDGTRFRYVFF